MLKRVAGLRKTRNRNNKVLKEIGKSYLKGNPDTRRGVQLPRRPQAAAQCSAVESRSPVGAPHYTAD